MPIPDSRGVPAVSIRNAHRWFGDLPVLTGVDFDVAPGRCCAVVGANGAGKSTLLRCVVGVDRLDAGVIDIDGTPVDETSRAFRRKVAAVLGEVPAFAHLTAHEHLQLVATGHGVPDRLAAAGEQARRAETPWIVWRLGFARGHRHPRWRSCSQETRPGECRPDLRRRDPRTRGVRDRTVELAGFGHDVGGVHRVAAQGVGRNEPPCFRWAARISSRDSAEVNGTLLVLCAQKVRKV